MPKKFAVVSVLVFCIAPVYAAAWTALDAGFGDGAVHVIIPPPRTSLAIDIEKPGYYPAGDSEMQTYSYRDGPTRVWMITMIYPGLNLTQTEEFLQSTADVLGGLSRAIDPSLVMHDSYGTPVKFEVWSNRQDSMYVGYWYLPNNVEVFAALETKLVAGDFEYLIQNIKVLPAPGGQRADFAVDSSQADVMHRSILNLHQI